MRKSIFQWVDENGYRLETERRGSIVMPSQCYFVTRILNSNGDLILEPGAGETVEDSFEKILNYIRYRMPYKLNKFEEMRGLYVDGNGLCDYIIKFNKIELVESVMDC